jgi:hypothetical protein
MSRLQLTIEQIVFARNYTIGLLDQTPWRWSARVCGRARLTAATPAVIRKRTIGNSFLPGAG